MMKALLLIVVLGAVWYLWKTISEQKAGIEAKEAAEADPTTPTADEVAETAECPVCKAYVSVKAEGGCGREECPIPALAEAMAEDMADGSSQPDQKPADPKPADKV
jgi:hypothetical protein